jgi:uncharacterized protein (TIGR03000 family)
MKKFRRSVFGAAWLGALAFTFGGADTASAHWFSRGSHGSSGGSGGYHVVSNVGVAGVAAERRVAYMNVNVPADATVYLQDQRMTLTGARRRFVTPEIKDGKELVYNLKVEIERDGRTVSKTTQAVVKAGQEVEVTVSFDEPAAGARVASVTPNRGR